LKVTLSNGLESTDKVKVTVNTNPTANAGGPYTGKVGQSITFDGSKSTDSDGTVSEYSWDFGDGATDITQNPLHTYNTAGTYTVKLVVKDNKGAISTESTTTVLIEVENSVPVANAGGPYSGKVGQSITFDGSKSTDSDGTIKDYLWDFGDGSSGSGLSPSHIFQAAGTYTIKLTVVDDKGLSSTTVTAAADISQEINNTQGSTQVTSTDTTTDATTTAATTTTTVPNNPPTANAGGPYSGKVGQSITFDGSKSTDSDGTIKDYLWDFGDGSSGSGISTSHIFQAAGTYTIKLTVVDNKGLSSTVVTTTAQVTTTDTTTDATTTTATTTTTTTTTTEVTNKPPVANAGGPYSANAGDSITFDGSASSDPDGTITEYLWDFGDGGTGKEIKPAHTYSSAGNYTVKLVVKDDKGLTSPESTASVTINQVVVQQQYPVNNSIITNSTSMIGYTEVTVDQLVSIFIKRGSTKVDWATRLAPLYIKYGKLFNIRADIAWAQMCHETAFLEFTGDVKPEQNNFVGLGATGGGVPGNSFATEELGVIAHYAHLAWYYYPDHVNQYCSITYDPRHFGTTHSKYTGDTSIGFLNGTWAPGVAYTDKILQFANQIYGF